MASPMPSEDFGLQPKPMGLKVHYTFDKDGQERCLARLPQLIQVQTLALDENTTIGLVDLRLCLQAVTQCSPEIASANSLHDYVIYAYDYTEPDTPLVGQGMLSWILDPTRASDNMSQSLNMVTGRVTKNLLAIFGNGIKETLEVKLKLTACSRVTRRQESQPLTRLPAPAPTADLQQNIDSVSTPTAEWNFFLQANPGLVNPQDPMSMNVGSPIPLPAEETRHPTPIAMGPSAAPATLMPTPLVSAPPSRPSSSASRKRSTGRPRGRPRKRPIGEGNTSGYEDGTDGDEAPPAKKRVTTTRVDRAVSAPFTAAPESLRVAASTSSSLRNFRPVTALGAPGANSQLQDLPRVPTPVPDRRNSCDLSHSGITGKSRRTSTLGQEPSIPPQPLSFSNPRAALSPEGDARSPDSVGRSPNYSDDSPAEIGSSPPVPRRTQFIHSSPPPSSPALPPMKPQLQPDSGFMSGGVDAVDDGDSFVQTIGLPEPKRAAPPPQRPVSRTSRPARSSRAQEMAKVPIQIYRLQEVRDGTHDLVRVSNPYSTIPMKLPESENPRPHVAHVRPSSPALPLPTQPSLQQQPPMARMDLQRDAMSASADAHQEIANYPSVMGTAASRVPSRVASPQPTTRPKEQRQQSSAPQPTAQSMQGKFSTAAPRTLQRSESLGPGSAMPGQSTSTETSAAGRPSALSKSNSFSEGTTYIPLPSLPTQKPQTQPSLPEPARASKATIPASDPTGPNNLIPVPCATSFSEAPFPPSDLPAPPSHQRHSPKPNNKNYVKKQSIKERLERAVENGEMPPFCFNCGSIETPTWRKIHTQEGTGVPEFYEFSEKPGRITAIDITDRDAEGKPTAYRLVKKALGPEDDRVAWVERLLCNPCGIWLSKNNKHRPADRWDKDRERIGRERRKRGTGRGPARRKKTTTSKDSQTGFTSEAYLPTDPTGPADNRSPAEDVSMSMPMDQLESLLETANSQHFGAAVPDTLQTASGRSGFSNAGSTHSRATGTANSPINVDPEDDLGSTRRILFPSPRSTSTREALRELSGNIVPPSDDREPKEMEADEVLESLAVGDHLDEDAEFDALFQTPAPPRPATPEPQERDAAPSSDLFKTPSRTTPSHRPITRSVTRTIRSVRNSPGSFAAVLRTPSRTPRGTLMVPASPTPRRSPRLNGSASRGERMRHYEEMPVNMTMDMDPLGVGMTDPFTDQAELDAILDKCLSSWGYTSPIKGKADWEINLTEEEYEGLLQESAMAPSQSEEASGQEISVGVD